MANNLLVKNHVQHPETRETWIRGTYPDVSDVDFYVLTSTHPEDCVDADALASENKDVLVDTAREAGVEVDASDTKADVAKKLGTSSAKSK